MGVDLLDEIPKSPLRTKATRWDDTGGVFLWGLALSPPFNFGRGYLSNPDRTSSRFANGVRFARVNSLRTAAYYTCALFAADSLCTAMVYYRQKCDSWDYFFTLGLPAAILTTARGPRFASCAALGVGSTFALLDYSGVFEALIKSEDNTSVCRTDFPPSFRNTNLKMLYAQLDELSHVSSEMEPTLFSAHHTETDGKGVVISRVTPRPTTEHQRTALASLHCSLDTEKLCIQVKSPISTTVFSVVRR